MKRGEVTCVKHQESQKSVDFIVSAQVLRQIAPSRHVPCFCSRQQYCIEGSPAMPKHDVKSCSSLRTENPPQHRKAGRPKPWLD